MDNIESPVLSFVIPVYNEASNIAALHHALVRVGEEIGEDFETVWVDDGSTDGTADELQALAKIDSRVRPILLSRNFGHMAALTAGLEAAAASGAIICMDGDGQHPPELVLQMVKFWRKGADIVQAIRLKSSDTSHIKSITSALFYRVLNALADADIPQGSADFRLMDRQVVDALNSLPERDRFLRGLVHWVGFTRELVQYEAPPRVAGNSKYGAVRMISLALSGITSFSIRPLRLSFLLGLLVTGAAMLYGFYVLVCYILGAPLVPGWTSLLLVVVTLSGIQLISLGIASEYIARLCREQKRRPVYIIRKQRETGEWSG